MLVEKSFDSVQILSVDYEALLSALNSAAFEIKRDVPDSEIFLFGSFAKGSYTPLSDVDLLIIVPQSDKPYLERKERFTAYFTLPFDVNIIVYTKEEIRQMQVNGNMFITSVLQEAREL